MKTYDVCSYTIEEMNEVCCDDAANKKIREKGINGRGFGGSLYLGVLVSLVSYDQFYWIQKKNTNLFSYRVWNENKWNFLPSNKQ